MGETGLRSKIRYRSSLYYFYSFPWINITSTKRLSLMLLYLLSSLLKFSWPYLFPIGQDSFLDSPVYSTGLFANLYDNTTSYRTELFCSQTEGTLCSSSGKAGLDCDIKWFRLWHRYGLCANQLKDDQWCVV